ncbi:dihydroneopterin aldolase, also has dihydroneopterin triphosphate [Candidatus Blochmanniella pennsylvanica str. BPEN]|uniref:Dihydroneopterin aldolase n=1 Tax=Blochmanniella pennsylvanica (strain BPEN) TaxID=291272 RepID=Q493X6_BLOPB|nr:dihydroneopterin aldolase [Candidatus Blochmannia pennsylvanicus]AAZ40708.1 dihydroneopterin aldolase, also has dihydroneopterin triphosphate [Candidatus Blochmannia pennsylvanicus str. BPEN]UOY04492.1 dihydroneopterin aldolase [Candidatus Blochmannia pennsylvanicus]
MMDILFIDRLTVMAYIGINDWEKNCLQKLIFDLQLSCNTEFFEDHQSVVSYIDYTHVNQVILSLVSQKHFYLIEDVANLIANTLIEKFCIYWVRVKVNKPGAIHNACNVGICVERKNKTLLKSLKKS